MKTKIILIASSLLSILLCSCHIKSALEKKIDELNEQCNFRLNTKFEDFPSIWKTKNWPDRYPEYFEYQSETEDGLFTYRCGTVDYFTTEFYFRDKKQVGFKTRDPEFGFSIYGYKIGSPAYGNQTTPDNDIEKTLYSNGFVIEDSQNEREKDVLPNGKKYTWKLSSFENKLHINYSVDLKNSYCYSLAEIEVFLDA